MKLMVYGLCQPLGACALPPGLSSISGEVVELFRNTRHQFESNILSAPVIWPLSPPLGGCSKGKASCDSTSTISIFGRIRDELRFASL